MINITQFSQYFLILLASVISQLAGAQTEYLVGTGRHSLDPPSTIFSVALAGYGVPRDGRFSLHWQETEYTKAVNDLIHQKRNEYNRLFGSKNQKKIHKTPKDPKSFVVTYNDIILIDENDQLWLAKNNKNLVWKHLGEASNIIDLAISNGKLYGLSSNNEILQLQSNAEWLRIAIFNGTTYNQKIKQIIVLKNQLYGIDETNTIYVAQHKTDHTMHAHAMTVKCDNDRIAVVSLDLCGFDESFVSQVKDEIRKKHHILPSALLVNASHTHFAPVSQNWHTWGPHCQKPDSSYLYDVVKPAIVKSIAEAIKAENNASLFFGREQTSIGRNRSITQAPIPYDQDVDVIKVKYRDDSPSDVLFMHGCHPVHVNDSDGGLTLSGNYPSSTRLVLEKDPKINHSMFLQGAGGDINPIDADHKVTGEKLASSVKTALENHMTPITGSINYHLDTINFNIKPWSQEKLIDFRNQYSEELGNVGAEKNVRWADLMLGYHKTGTMPTQMPVYIQTINIGNWKLVGLSREVVTEYSLGIKKLYPNQLVSVAGYTNDVSSYLPTSKHINAGTYEGNDSFFWYGQPAIFPENVYETIIKSIKTKNR